jgi:hypothetical protein
MGAIITPMRHTRGRLPPGPLSGRQRPAAPGSGGRPEKTERPHPGRPGAPNPSSCDRAPHRLSPRAQVRLAALTRFPRPEDPAPSRRHTPRPATRSSRSRPAQPISPCTPEPSRPPCCLIIPLPGQPRPRAPAASPRERCAPLDPGRPSAGPGQLSGAGRQVRRALNVITKPATTPKPGRLHCWPDTGKGSRSALRAPTRSRMSTDARSVRVHAARHSPMREYRKIVLHRSQFRFGTVSA